MAGEDRSHLKGHLDNLRKALICLWQAGAEALLTGAAYLAGRIFEKGLIDLATCLSGGSICAQNMMPEITAGRVVSSSAIASSFNQPTRHRSAFLRRAVPLL